MSNLTLREVSRDIVRLQMTGHAERRAYHPADAPAGGCVRPTDVARPELGPGTRRTRSAISAGRYSPPILFRARNIWSLAAAAQQQQVRLHALVHRLGLQDDWPKTPSGRDFIMADGDNLPEGEKIFKHMALRCPYLEPLRQVRKFVTTLRSFELYIGDDNRCRVYPNPWWTNTGRANPGNSNFIFTLPKGVRPMTIKPGDGQALGYVDLKSAEVGIAARSKR